MPHPHVQSLAAPSGHQSLVTALKNEVRSACAPAGELARPEAAAKVYDAVATGVTALAAPAVMRQGVEGPPSACGAPPQVYDIYDSAASKAAKALNLATDVRETMCGPRADPPSGCGATSPSFPARHPPAHAPPRGSAGRLGIPTARRVDEDYHLEATLPPRSPQAALPARLAARSRSQRGCASAAAAEEPRSQTAGRPEGWKGRKAGSDSG